MAVSFIIAPDDDDSSIMSLKWLGQNFGAESHQTELTNTSEMVKNGRIDSSWVKIGPPENFQNLHQTFGVKSKIY